MTIRIFSLVAVTLAIIGCASSDSGTTSVEYVGTWGLETPLSASMMYTTDLDPNPVELNGAMSVTLGAMNDGVLSIAFRFESTDYPCGATDPCGIDFATGEFRHQYLGAGTSPDGVEAASVRVSRVDPPQSSDGYVYVDGGRLCLSNNLWEIVAEGLRTGMSGADPLAIDFVNCFSKQV
jgi:hypothetical protein